MPSGAEAFARKKEQKAQSQGGGVAAAGDLKRLKADKFEIKDRQYAIVRFLEQGGDLTFVDRHEIPAGGRYPGHFVCLNTNDDGSPCPACESSNPDISKRAQRGLVNMIWRDGPVYKRSDKGWVERDPSTKQPIILGRQDIVVLWYCSWDVFEDLMGKDSAHHGLMMRDYRVSRTGAGMQDTKYAVEPADIDAGQQAMTIADMSLAESKSDLRALSTPLSYAELHQVVHGGQNPSPGPQPTFDQSARTAPTAQSVFDGGPAVPASAFSRG